MVRRGLARNCERFRGGRYCAAEMQAAAEGANLSIARIVHAKVTGPSPVAVAIVEDEIVEDGNLLDEVFLKGYAQIAAPVIVVVQVAVLADTNLSETDQAFRSQKYGTRTPQ